MTDHFTLSISDSIWQFHDDDYADALQYLNNPKNFRSFSSGLTELLCRCSYTGSLDSVEERTTFLCTKLKDIGVKISKQTVKDWFLDKRRPTVSSTSRTIMYQVCFSLLSSLEDVKWFFHHVYFDRSFNCHLITEAVYYYCFLNGHSFTHANALLEKIDAMPLLSLPEETDVNFTNEVKHFVESCNTDEELLAFFEQNKHSFQAWNRSASANINALLSLIRGKESDKEVLDRKLASKRTKPEDIVKYDEIKQCGVVVQEILFDNKEEHISDEIANLDISSIDFMLHHILYWNKNIHKNVDLPDIVRKNFPNKMVFSKLKDINESTSYDSIRKCLILLKFYSFWCDFKFNSLKEHEEPFLFFDIFLDEMNALLTECGYEELYSGNPYDWIFLTASTASNPLDYFRNIYADAVDEEKE